MTSIIVNQNYLIIYQRRKYKFRKRFNFLCIFSWNTKSWNIHDWLWEIYTFIRQGAKKVMPDCPGGEWILQSGKWSFFLYQILKLEY